MNIVETVAAEIDRVIFLPGVNTPATSRSAARAAIKATLEHLRENISDEMWVAGNRKIHIGTANAYQAMIDQALKEME